MKICSLSSGSKGNSLYIESENARILIDLGLSAFQIRQSLEEINISADTIDAIVLTHSHTDHVRGAGTFSRQFNTPIYGHPDTLDDISYLFKQYEPIQPWQDSFFINDLHVTPFQLSHDAFPTFGYLISDGYKKIGICTDLGIVTPTVIEHLQQANFLVIESNHDPEMLRNGPYPIELKERILSRVGHLSNHDTGELLKELLNGRVDHIILAHLSEENNTLELAKETVIEYIGHQFSDMIDVFEQKKVSPIFEI
jgi:phosphoribosyl 1,2-cyclic phosphodiesterase